MLTYHIHDSKLDVKSATVTGRPGSFASWDNIAKPVGNALIQYPVVADHTILDKSYIIRRYSLFPWAQSYQSVLESYEGPG